MGVSPAIFESGGQRSEHYVPGVYGRSFNISSPAGISAGNLCILGKSSGGEPYKMLEFSGIADAKETLIGGELLDAIANAFSASSNFIPQRVFAMRVDSATQSNTILKSGGVDLLNVKSWDWGIHTNQLKMLITYGTQVNTKKISLVYKNIVGEADNIGNAALSVEYYGENNNPKVTVNANSITFVAETDEETPQPIDSLTISFDDFTTLETLATRINDSDIWQAVVIGNNAELPSLSLDTITSVSVAEGGTTLYANYEAFVATLKNMDLIGNVEILAAGTRVVPDNTESYVYFTGGSDGEYSVNQWQTALAALELEDVQIIATPATDSAIHALISSHCTSMSDVIHRKERTAILGGNIGMTDEEAKAEALGLNNRLISFCCDNPIKINLITGNTETMSGAMLGVMLAAMESAMS